jgi:membrane protein required for colicin V production
MENLNQLDILIGVIVILMGMKGYIHGFFRELLGFIGIILGIFLASRFSVIMSTFISEHIMHIENKTLLTVVGFFAVLAIVWFSIMSLGSILSKLSSVAGLGFINNILGFIVGGGKYFIIFAVIITALSNVALLKETIGKYTSSSMVAPYLLATGSYVINLDPKEISISDIKPSSDILNDKNQTK